MVCKNCKRAIDDDSIFCKWCGDRQIRERKKKGEVKVPKPRQLADGRWFAQVMIDGERHNVYGNTIAEYETNARALKQGLIKAGKRPDDITVAQAIDKFTTAILAFEHVKETVNVSGFRVLGNGNF